MNIKVEVLYKELIIMVTCLGPKLLGFLFWISPDYGMQVQCISEPKIIIFGRCYHVVMEGATILSPMIVTSSSVTRLCEYATLLNGYQALCLPCVSDMLRSSLSIGFDGRSASACFNPAEGRLVATEYAIIAESHLVQLSKKRSSMSGFFIISSNSPDI